MFKIFVGNLDYKVRPEQVRELFAIYTPIEDLVLPTDPKTNKPRGFAIVMVRDPELGAAAIRGVQGRRLMGRELVVNEAIKKKGKGPAPPASPTRNGPFGPRMFQSADGRGRGNRNPRRSHGGASPRQAGAVGGTGSSKAVSGQPSSPPGSPSAGGGAPRASSAVGTSPPSQSPVPQGDPATGAIRSSPPKAKPKLPPSAGLG